MQIGFKRSGGSNTEERPQAGPSTASATMTAGRVTTLAGDRARVGQQDPASVAPPPKVQERAAPGMTRILFVDDERSVLDGLRRLFHPFRAEWSTSFAEGGAQALELLSKEPIDVIVTDIRMPGMDGTELLGRVRESYPHIIRIILSGQADRDLTLRSAATAHQYLSKPCDAQTLILTIARGSALKDVLNDAALQSLVGSAKSLPSVPALYVQLLDQLENPDSSAADIATVIGSDTAMTAKILQLANSAFFGIRRRIVTPKDAVLYLGIDTVKALALTVKVFSGYTRTGCSRFSVQNLSQHCVHTGALARKLAKAIGLAERDIEDSFMAGLLHDVGKLILVDAFPDKYTSVMRMAETEGVSCWEAEQSVFGTSHAEIGTYLLWLWGLPDSVVEAVAYHHAPSRCPAQQRGPLAAVHMANVLSRMHSQGGETDRPEIDRAYIERLGLPVDLAAWQVLAGEALQEQETK